MSSSVQVAVYDDRVEISSPGSIYGSLTLEEALEGRSSIRNKTLASTLEKIDVLECWDSGFKRIFAECDEYGVDRPEFLEIGDKKADKFRARILEYLVSHPNAKTQEISLEIGLKQSRTKVYLSELVEDGKIVANGANRNRAYSLKK